MGKNFYDPIIYKSTSYIPFVAGPSVVLTEPIDGKLLSEAIEELRSRFPYFYVRVKVEDNDLVFEPNPLPVVVRNSWEPINLYSKEANYHFMTFKYEGNRFMAEVAHSVTDGAGFLPYLKSLLYCYITKKTGVKINPEGFRLPGEKISASEVGNPFPNLDFDAIDISASKNMYQNDFYRLREKFSTDRKDWQIFYLNLPEDNVMSFCKSNGGTPNVLFAVLLAKAIRRIDSESKKTITVGVGVDCKAVMGNTENYKAFVGPAILDFPIEQENVDIADIIRTERRKLKEQASQEKIQCFLKKLKTGFEQMSQLPLQTKIDLTQKACSTQLETIGVSYVKIKTFGPLDPYIQELYGIGEPGFTDIVFEIQCINNKFCITFIQNFSDEILFNAFLKEMENIGIPYEIKGKEPCRLSGIRYDGIEGLNI